jgi:hypothetical protein
MRAMIGARFISMRPLLLAIGFILFGQASAAQSDRVVALVVSVADSTRADVVQAALQAMGAETLRSIDPNNAEMRSMLRRFADESENARATFVYLDMPAVIFAEREYVLPEGTGLTYSSDALAHPTDLFTKSIPLLSFARIAGLAEQGGTVIMTVSDPVDGLLDGLTQVVVAPEPVPGASPVLIVNNADAAPIIQTIEAMRRDSAVEVGAMLRRMAVHDGVTISALPESSIFLKEKPASEPVRDEVLESAVIPEDTTPPETVEPAETLEELTVLQQSLSRSEKRSIQRSLRDLGFYNGLVDGIFGPQTSDAVATFQTERGEEATGLLNSRQLLALRTRE